MRNGKVVKRLTQSEVELKRQRREERRRKEEERRLYWQQYVEVDRDEDDWHAHDRLRHRIHHL